MGSKSVPLYCYELLFLARFLSQEVNFLAESNSLKQHFKYNIFSAVLIILAFHLKLIFQFLYQVFFTAPDLQHPSTIYSVLCFTPNRRNVSILWQRGYIIEVCVFSFISSSKPEYHSHYSLQRNSGIETALRNWNSWVIQGRSGTPSRDCSRSSFNKHTLSKIHYFTPFLFYLFFFLSFEKCFFKSKLINQ